MLAQLPPDLKESKLSPQTLQRARQIQQTKRAEESFHEFVRQGWHVLEPHKPFIDGIHVEAICAHLQGVSEGRIADLIINVPPGHAKSLLTAVFWPAWDWIHHPERRFVFSTYKEDLTLRDSVKCRTLIRSNWYQERWGRRFHILRSQDQKHRFGNDQTGYRVVVTVGSGTGERGDVIVVDDPTSADQAQSDKEREKANTWWTSTMSTRLNDDRCGHRVVIQQRLHEQDLTGVLLTAGGYVHLCLPERFETERACVTTIWKDPRRTEGELLWPGYRTMAESLATERRLTPYPWSGQYQQRPSPLAGGIFQRSHWRYWRPRNSIEAEYPPVAAKNAAGDIEMVPVEVLPDDMTRFAQSWDMAKRVLHVSDDPVAGGVWAAKGANRYLLHQVCRPMDMAETIAAVELVSKDYPYAAVKWVEAAANGPAVIAALKGRVSGLVSIPPEGGKTARALACSAEVRSGNVFLPHPKLADWVPAYIEECALFPNAKHDDQVDQTSQALNQFRTQPGPVYEVLEKSIVIDPCMIPPSWPQGFALAFAGGRSAILWAARDPGGDLVIIAERKVEHAEPNENARIIQERGIWIPGIVEQTAPGRTVADGMRAIQQYMVAKVQLSSMDAAPQSGVQATLQMFTAGRIKVFKTLSKTLDEWRTFWKDPDGNPPHGFLLMDCLRLLCLHKDRMKTKPAIPRRAPQISSGDRSWMGR